MYNTAITDAWEQTSISERLLCLNDEYESALTFLENPVQNNTLHLNREQTGTGLQTHSFPTLDPTAPNFGLSSNDVVQLVRNGGEINGYTVVPRNRFNSVVLHRTLNLRDAPSTDMASYTVYVHNMLSDIVSFSRVLAGDGSVINITLRGDSLTSDVNALLSSRDGYNVDRFADAIERVMQSNKHITTDNSLVLTVSIAMSKNGGVRRKVRDLAHNQVIDRNRMNLFCPTNISNNLCFAICLAHFLNPHAPHNTLETIADQIQAKAGYMRDHKVGFNDIGRFEFKFGVKIVVFHKSSSGGLEKYQTKDKPHARTVFLYLHDRHYYLVKKFESVHGCTVCLQVLL